MSFCKNNKVVEMGDTAIIYFGHDSLQHIIVKKDEITQTKYGAIKHNQLVGHKYGHKFSTTKGWVHVLQATPELWTLSLPHRTQILYTPDIAMVTLQLDLKPGSIVCESGTGSGSLSHAILRTIAPTGYLHTTEFHEQRAAVARKEFKDHGFEDCVTVYHGDVLVDGFHVEGKADAVFLDVPKPWEAVKHAIKAFKPEGGRFCSFSPCIEQVQRTCLALHESGQFGEIQTIEQVHKSHNIRRILLPIADIGLSDPDVEQALCGEGLTSEILPCAYNTGDKLDAGELVPAPSKDENFSKRRNSSTKDGPSKKRKKYDSPEVTIEKTDETNDNSLQNKRKHNSNSAPATTKTMFASRTYVLPKQIYGHTGYLTFASYFPK